MASTDRRLHRALFEGYLVHGTLMAQSVGL